MEILETKNLSKIYKEGTNVLNALNHINLKIPTGQFVSIVGPSGSGKSTLLHLIGGLDKPTEGQVYINNNDIYSLKNKLPIFRRRNIGIVYQFYNLIPMLNVLDNITLPVELDHKKINKKELNELIKILKLEHRLNHLPYQLSGGEQQRVAIARALINRPSVLLADEPTGNLDSKSGEEVMKLLKKSNKIYNQTIIMITHNLSLAQLTDRIITVKDGQIIKDELL